MHLKSIFIFIAFFPLSSVLGQAVGIGTLNPTIARLEVMGASSTGSNFAVFGTEGHGISLHKNYPVIGFNQYRESNTIGSTSKYMANGYAHSMFFDYFNGTLTLNSNPSGIKDTRISTNFPSLHITNEAKIIIPNTIYYNIPIDASLTVNYNEKRNNTIIEGSVFSSIFALHTRINGGKANSKVYINDIPGGKVTIGSSTLISDNLTNENLPISLNVRGGIAFTKRDEYQPCGNTSYDPQNNSYVNVKPSCGSSEMKINNGIIDGQILIIQAEGNNDFLIKDINNINLPADLYMGGGDILMLLWKIADNQWYQISYSNN